MYTPTPEKKGETRLNWTKVGLKEEYNVAYLDVAESLNWTKVGLKVH
mgnify:CR=1 FL=1